MYLSNLYLSLLATFYIDIDGVMTVQLAIEKLIRAGDEKLVGFDWE